MSLVLVALTLEKDVPEVTIASAAQDLDPASARLELLQVGLTTQRAHITARKGWPSASSSKF